MKKIVILLLMFIGSLLHGSTIAPTTKSPELALAALFFRQYCQSSTTLLQKTLTIGEKIIEKENLGPNAFTNLQKVYNQLKPNNTLTLNANTNLSDLGLSIDDVISMFFNKLNDVNAVNKEAYEIKQFAIKLAPTETSETSNLSDVNMVKLQNAIQASSLYKNHSEILDYRKGINSALQKAEITLGDNEYTSPEFLNFVNTEITRSTGTNPSTQPTDYRPLAMQYLIDKINQNSTAEDIVTLIKNIKRLSPDVNQAENYSLINDLSNRLEKRGVKFADLFANYRVDGQKAILNELPNSSQVNLFDMLNKEQLEAKKIILANLIDNSPKDALNIIKTILNGDNDDKFTQINNLLSGLDQNQKILNEAINITNVKTDLKSLLLGKAFTALYLNSPQRKDADKLIQTLATETPDVIQKQIQDWLKSNPNDAFIKINTLLNLLPAEQQLKFLSTPTDTALINGENVTQSTLATDIINAAYTQDNYNKNGRADLIKLINDIKPEVIDGGITWVTKQAGQMGNFDEPLLKAFTFLDNLGLKLGLLDNIIANNKAYQNGIPANKQLSNTAIFNGLESLAMQQGTGIVSKGNFVTKAITKAVNWFKDIFKFGNGDSIVKSYKNLKLAEFVDSMSTQQNDETFKAALDKLIENGIKPEIIMEKIIAKYLQANFKRTDMGAVRENLQKVMDRIETEETESYRAILSKFKEFKTFADTIEKIKNAKFESDIDVLTKLLGLRLAISETSDEPLISTDDQIRQIYELVKSKYSGSNRPNYLESFESFKDYFTKLPVSNRATTLTDFLLWLKPILDLPKDATFENIVEKSKINSSQDRTLNILTDDKEPQEILDTEKEYIEKTQIKLQEILAKLTPDQIAQAKENLNFKDFVELFNKLAIITQIKIPENIMDIITPIETTIQEGRGSGVSPVIFSPRKNLGDGNEGEFEEGTEL